MRSALSSVDECSKRRATFDHSQRGSAMWRLLLRGSREDSRFQSAYPL
jgi:hypothetical protein